MTTPNRIIIIITMIKNDPFGKRECEMALSKNFSPAYNFSFYRTVFFFGFILLHSIRTMCSTHFSKERAQEKRMLEHQIR